MKYQILVFCILWGFGVAGILSAAKTPVTQSPLELRVEELERKISELEKRLPPVPTWNVQAIEGGK